MQSIDTFFGVDFVHYQSVANSDKVENVFFSSHST